LLAFDLRLGKLLWFKEHVGTQGLINVIAAPQIGYDSTYRPQNSNRNPVETKLAIEESCAKAYLSELEDAHFSGHSFGMTGKGIYFIDLPLRFDVNLLQKETRFLEEAYD